MAGDTKETGPGPDEVVSPDTLPYVDPFPSLDAKLGAIIDALAGLGQNGPEVFDLAAFGAANIAQHMWLRLHIQTIVVSCTAAGTFILNVGSFARTWNLDIGTTVIPYPITVERGTDLSFAGAAAGLNGYVLATADTE